MAIGGRWSLTRPANVGSFTFVRGSLGLDCGPFERVTEDERHLVVTEGQSFDSSWDLSDLDPTLLESSYGLFLYVAYDKTTDRLQIGTDRFGYFPLYYAFEDDCLIFSSSLGFVKNQLQFKTPNYEAWEELMVLGEVIGDKTTVAQIKRLPVGTRIRTDAQRIEFVRYWEPELPDPVDESTYIRENNCLLDEAMRLTSDCTRRKVVLLSGGEDSRRLALAATRANLGADFFTQESIYKGLYTTHVDRDVKLAARVATFLGGDHYVEALPANEHYLEDWKTRDTKLGFECTAHDWLLPLARRIEPKALVYDGIVGDITINGHFFRAFPQAVENYRDIDGLARLICGPHEPDWLSEFRLRGQTSLFDRVRTLLGAYPESPHRITFYFVLNHARRKTALVSQLFKWYGHWTCYPYLYYPLFLQSLSADPSVQVHKFYQRECMAALDPSILSIPTTRGPLDPKWCIPRHKENASQETYLLRHLQVSNDALDFFPTFRFRYRILRTMPRLSGQLFRRFGWFIVPLARFSAFLEWIQRSDDDGSDSLREPTGACRREH